MKNVAIVVAAVVVLAGGFLVAKNDAEESREASRGAGPPVGATPAATAPTGTTAPAEPAATPAPEPAATKVPVVRFADGEVRGGVQELEFDKGERIRFTIASDVAEEVHVHGFDLYEDVPAGGRVTLDFTGTADGRYEVEMHGSGTQIAELKIAP